MRVGGAAARWAADDRVMAASLADVGGARVHPTRNARYMRSRGSTRRRCWWGRRELMAAARLGRPKVVRPMTARSLTRARATGAITPVGGERGAEEGAGGRPPTGRDRVRG